MTTMPRAVGFPLSGCALSFSVKDPEQQSRSKGKGAHPGRTQGRQRGTRRQASGLGAYYFADMCSSSEAGSYLRLIDLCITHL